MPSLGDTHPLLNTVDYLVVMVWPPNLVVGRGLRVQTTTDRPNNTSGNDQDRISSTSAADVLHGQ